jgi:hypothetical protein
MYKLAIPFLFAVALIASFAPAQMLPISAPPAAPTTAPSDSAADKSTARNAPTAGEISATRASGNSSRARSAVTLEDVKSPVFWVDTIRDLAYAVITFIPRLINALLFLVSSGWSTERPPPGAWVDEQARTSMNRSATRWPP